MTDPEEPVSDIDFSDVDEKIREYKAFLDNLYSEHSTFVNALASDAQFAAAQVRAIDDPYDAGHI